MSTDKTTDEPTVKDVQEQTSKPEKTETPEETVKTEEKQDTDSNESETTEKPLGELLQDEPVKDSGKKQEVDFKELYKKERKNKRQLESKLKELEENIGDDDYSDDDIASDIDDLADEFNVDKKFLKKLQKSIESKLDSKYEETVNSKLKPFEEKEKAEKFNNVFNGYFEKALDKMPEFEEVVNKDVIKTLATQPQNANKTLSQLIEETYGNALGGKRSIEKGTPRGGAEPTEVDFTKAQTDGEYFKQIMASPDLKKKYNEGLAKRVLR